MSKFKRTKKHLYGGSLKPINPNPEFSNNQNEMDAFAQDYIDRQNGMQDIDNKLQRYSGNTGIFNAASDIDKNIDYYTGNQLRKLALKSMTGQAPDEVSGEDISKAVLQKNDPIGYEKMKEMGMEGNPLEKPLGMGIDIASDYKNLFGPALAGVGRIKRIPNLPKSLEHLAKDKVLQAIESTPSKYGSSEIAQPHYIFTSENPRFPAKTTMSNEDIINHLKQMGEDVEHVQGKYGSPENSILVKNPKNVDYLNKLSKDLGQESSLMSTGSEHKLQYLNGPEEGKIIKGKGTQWHETTPEDNYTSYKGKNFTHNLDFDNPEMLSKPAPSSYSPKEEALKEMYSKMNPKNEFGYREPKEIKFPPEPPKVQVSEKTPVMETDPNASKIADITEHGIDHPTIAPKPELATRLPEKPLGADLPNYSETDEDALKRMIGFYEDYGQFPSTKKPK